MLPSLAAQDMPDMTTLDAIAPTEGFLGKIRVAPSVIPPDGADYLVRNLGARIALPAKVWEPSSFDAVRDIVGVSPFNDVLRVNAVPDIANMANQRSGPAFVGEKEYETGGTNSLSLVPNFPVPVIVEPVGPMQAFFGFVVGYGFNEGGETGKLFGHLRSFIAMVLRRVRCFNSASLCSIALAVLSVSAAAQTVVNGGFALPTPNNTSPGTVLYGTAKMNPTGDGTAIAATTADTAVPTFCVSGGAGNAPNTSADLPVVGGMRCTMDSNESNVGGAIVVNSPTIDGRAHALALGTFPTPGTWVIGIMSDTTTSSSGTAQSRVRYVGTWYGGGAVLPSGTQACSLVNTNGATGYATSCWQLDLSVITGIRSNDFCDKIRTAVSVAPLNTTVFLQARSLIGPQSCAIDPAIDLIGSGWSPVKTFVIDFGNTQLSANAPITLLGGSKIIGLGVQTGPLASDFVGSLIQANTLPATYTTGTATNTASIGGSPLTLTAAGAASGGNTIYTGTITGGGSNAFAGQWIQIQKFTNVSNNGMFLCVASTTTTLTLQNSGGIAETHAGQANSTFVSTVTFSVAPGSSLVPGMRFEACNASATSAHYGTACTGTAAGTGWGGTVQSVSGSSAVVISNASIPANASSYNFVAFSPVLMAGDGSGAQVQNQNFDVVISHVRVDANGVAGSVPIYNTNCANLCDFNFNTIDPSNNAGYLDDGPNTQQSSFHDNWIICNTGSCVTTSVGIISRVFTANSYPFKNNAVVMTQAGSNGATNAVWLDGPIWWEGGKVFANSLSVGSGSAGFLVGGAQACPVVCDAQPYTTTGARIEDVNFASPMEYGILWGTNASPVSYGVDGIRSSAGNYSAAITSCAAVTGTVTCTGSAFNLIQNEYVTIAGNTVYNGLWQVTAQTGTTFQFLSALTGTGTGGTVAANYVAFLISDPNTGCIISANQFSENELAKYTTNSNGAIAGDGTSATPSCMPLIGVSINNQTGTSYTYTTADNAVQTHFVNSSPIAVTLPAASTMPTGWFNESCDEGTGTATITSVSTLNVNIGSGTTTGTTQTLTTGQCIKWTTNNTNYTGILEPGNVGTITVYKAGVPEQDIPYTKVTSCSSGTLSYTLENGFSLYTSSTSWNCSCTDRSNNLNPCNAAPTSSTALTGLCNGTDSLYLSCLGK